MTMSNRNAFTLFEVLLALAVFMLAVVGLATALNTSIQSALEVRQHAILRNELESRLALRLAVPLKNEKVVLDGEANHGIRIEETLSPYLVKNQDGNEIPNIRKLTITASANGASDSASILVNLVNQ